MKFFTSLKSHRLILLILFFYIFWSTSVETVLTLRSFLENSYPDVANTILNKPFWKLFLPQQELTGSYSTTSLLLYRFLEILVGSTGITYQIVTCIMLLTMYFTVFKIFNSKLAATLSALALALSTHNYHMYSISGSTVIPLISTYALLTLFFQIQFIKDGKPKDLAVFALALMIFAISYEGWLDYFAWLTLLIPFALYGLNKKKDRQRFVRTLFAYSLQVVVVLSYLLIKLKFGYGQQAGSESDIVFNYPSPIAILEDILSNTIKQSYLTMNNYFPPFFLTSNTLLFHNKTWLIEQQAGYHEKFSELAYMNHLFLWRYYAGAWMAAWVYWAWKRFQKFSDNYAYFDLAIFSLLLAIPFGGATHTITKFRPFNAVPLLGYHVWFNVLLVTILISVLFAKSVSNINPKKKRLFLGLFVSNLLLVAIIKPTYLNSMASQVEMGTYPQPLKKLVNKLRSIN